MDEFYVRETFTDGHLRVDTGGYPNERGRDEEAVRVIQSQDGNLVVEVRGAGLAGPPHFGFPDKVTLTFTKYGENPIPVIINSRSETCAFHPMEEEPLQDLNTRLATMWKGSPPPVPVKLSPLQEWRPKLSGLVGLAACAALGLYAVERWSPGAPSFRVAYGAAFVGMITVMVVFTTRNHRRR